MTSVKLDIPAQGPWDVLLPEDVVYVVRSTEYRGERFCRGSAEQVKCVQNARLAAVVRPDQHRQGPELDGHVAQALEVLNAQLGDHRAPSTPFRPAASVGTPRGRGPTV